VVQQLRECWLVDPLLAEGALVYAVHKVKDTPLSRIFYELYESREAFDAHETSGAHEIFLEIREQHLTGALLLW
jgi:quinol monooxygenase YgiN